jgi:uncharacterized membrane protein
MLGRQVNNRPLIKEVSMNNIIAARFQTDDEAKAASASLADLVDKNDICIFFNNQPGAHDSERDASSSGDQGAATGATTGAASGSVVAGTIGTIVGGPAVGAVAAAVGGYTGSLAGTAGGLPDKGEATNEGPHPRSAGMMVAIRVVNADNSNQIIERLRSYGAVDIERAQGKWVNGDWVDFDPVTPPQLVS